MAEGSQLWDEDLSEEQTAKLIDRAAREICRRKLQTPAILMLEMNKPILPVAAHASIAFAPFAVPFVGFDMFNDYSRLVAKRENVERLLVRIEEMTKSGDTGSNNPQLSENHEADERKISSGLAEAN